MGYYTTGTSGSLRTDTWEYKFLTDVWNKISTFDSAASRSVVTFSINNRVIVVTGASSNYKFDDTYDFFSFEEYEEYD